MACWLPESSMCMGIGRKRFRHDELCESGLRSRRSHFKCAFPSGPQPASAPGHLFVSTQADSNTEHKPSSNSSNSSNPADFIPQEPFVTLGSSTPGAHWGQLHNLWSSDREARRRRGSGVEGAEGRSAGGVLLEGQITSEGAPSYALPPSSSLSSSPKAQPQH